MTMIASVGCADRHATVAALCACRNDRRARCREGNQIGWAQWRAGVTQ